MVSHEATRQLAILIVELRTLLRKHFEQKQPTSQARPSIAAFIWYVFIAEFLCSDQLYEEKYFARRLWKKFALNFIRNVDT